MSSIDDATIRPSKSKGNDRLTRCQIINQKAVRGFSSFKMVINEFSIADYISLSVHYTKRTIFEREKLIKGQI